MTVQDLVNSWNTATSAVANDNTAISTAQANLVTDTATLGNAGNALASAITGTVGVGVVNADTSISIITATGPFATQLVVSIYPAAGSVTVPAAPPASSGS